MKNPELEALEKKYGDLLSRYPDSKSLEVARDYLDKARGLPKNGWDYRGAIEQVEHMFEICVGPTDPIQIYWRTIAMNGGRK